tara:strand:- start:2649 stop:3347 length:699 start_codon:yes stop_codon:yes gene_type:complete
MKIAFLSDIHSNIEAFDAVLKIIEQKNIDRIYIAGDLVGYYYYADEVIDLCMNRKDIFCIRGNHERNFLSALSDSSIMEKFTKKYGSSYLRSKEQLSTSQITWLKNLPTKLTAKLDNVTLTIAHGSIHDEDEYVYPDASIETLINQLSSSDVTVLGHTHHSFVWSYKNKYLINPGSVGQPRDQSSQASFFVLNTSNMSIVPFKVNFSCERLKNDISKFDPSYSYLTRVLERK